MKQEINKNIFSTRLKEIMEENNQTVYTLAELLHLSAPTISRYMNGQMSPKIITIEKIASIFNINPVWLMGYDVEKIYEEPKIFRNSYIAIDGEELANDLINKGIITIAAHKSTDEEWTDEELEEIENFKKYVLSKRNKKDNK